MKLISFSLWGSDPSYLDGALENAKTANHFYPDYICRFYIHSGVDSKYPDELKRLGAEVVIKEGDAEKYGYYWRFEPIADNSIERVLIRDTDSRFSDREESAVREWEKSKLPIHIMRDDNAHNHEFVCGACGFVCGCISDFRKLLREWLNGLRPIEPPIKPGKPYYYTDEEFFCQKIWPMVKNIHMAHDEYFHFSGKEKPFPKPGPTVCKKYMIGG